MTTLTIESVIGNLQKQLGVKWNKHQQNTTKLFLAMLIHDAQSNQVIKEYADEVLRDTHNKILYGEQVNPLPTLAEIEKHNLAKPEPKKPTRFETRDWTPPTPAYKLGTSKKQAYVSEFELGPVDESNQYSYKKKGA
ncbi:predicted ORF [Xanthomonas phage XacN1]|nr:predicted ORF [Xanthomonas phage XacN1]